MKKYLLLIITFAFGYLPIVALAKNNNGIAIAAHNQIGKTLIYDSRYMSLKYPMGDLPILRGVCTDVVIRALRDSHQIDLQKQVHEDMKSNFSVYPKTWGLKKTDTNIDHRRVPNLETYFKRLGKSLPLTNNPADFKAGDIVSWRLDSGVPHIGIVSNSQNADNTRPMVIHNIGYGAQEEDVLFAWKMIGYYRY